MNMNQPDSEPAPRRILICGSSRWLRADAIDRVIADEFARYPLLLVIHGDHRRGVDAFARDYCRCHGIAQMAFPAAWDYYDVEAGSIRNEWVLVYGQPHIVYAFVRPGADNDTADMLRRAALARVPVVEPAR